MQDEAAIRLLLEEPEGAHCEFKEWKNHFRFDEAARYCCALANRGGGKFIVGVSDKRPRNVVGTTACEQPERICISLCGKLHVGVSFECAIYEGKRVLIFEIASRSSGLPVHVDGIAWWRESDSLVYMPEEVRRAIYDETGHDFSADICPEATLLDLDADAIETFRAMWLEKSKNTRIKTLSTGQLLLDCEAVTSQGVTYAALILFGKKASLGRFLAQSEVAFEYRSSEVSGPAQQREDFRAGFFLYYNKLWELINLRNNRQSYQDGLVMLDILTFNERVVREALLNAVSHRNYQAYGSVFVRQYNDRLVIESPGGLPAGVSVKNILDKQVPRNRRIAEMFQKCGLVERSGQGMNLMFELSVREAKALPDFTGTDDNSVRITLNGLVLDQRMLTAIKRIGDERLELLSTVDFVIINYLFREAEFPADLLGRIKNLVDMGIVEHTGRRKYVLARRLYESVGKAGVHTRLVGLNQGQNKALIYNHIASGGSDGTPMSELQQVLPNLSRGQVQLLLRQLRSEGKIKLSGKTRAAKWLKI